MDIKFIKVDAVVLKQYALVLMVDEKEVELQLDENLSSYAQTHQRVLRHSKDMLWVEGQHELYKV